MSRASQLDVELIESDVELDDSYVVEPDNDPPEEVSPNAENVKNHREKYENLRKERELRRAELERQRRESEAALGLSNGEVIGINSTSILRTKLSDAAKVSRLAIIYFTATWCGPCRYISPEVTRLAKKYLNVVFLKADIDEARDAAMEWKVSAVPTFFFVKNKRGVDQLVSTDRNVLEKKIIQHAG